MTRTMTVADLRAALEGCDPNLPVCACRADGRYDPIPATGGTAVEADENPADAQDEGLRALLRPCFMLQLEDGAAGSPVEASSNGPSVGSEDGDVLHDICLAACAEWEVDPAWSGFIGELVDGTNGSAGKFDPNVATEYAGQLAAAIGYRLAEGEDEASIRRLDFITLYNTEMVP